MVTGDVIQLLVDAAREDEGRKGVEVGQKDYRVDDLG